MNNLFSYLKICKEILTFEYISLGDVDIEKVLVSNKISFSEKNYKYFIGYLYNGNKVKASNIMLPKISSYVETKWTYFLIDDDDLLKKYNTIWDQFSADEEKQLDSEHVCDKDFLKTKIKFHGDEVTYFCDKKFQTWTLSILA